MFLFTTPTSRPAAAPAATPVVDAIRQGAEKTGVEFDYLLATAQRESALDPKAQARGSSASGLFQFVEQTWLRMVKSEGDKAGLSAYASSISTRNDGTHTVEDPSVRKAILDLRQDPAVASVMAGALTEKNRAALAAELGREPSNGDLYAAHFLGAGGASDLIKTAASNPSYPIATDFPSAAAANRTIFFDRDGRARGAGEVYALLAGAAGQGGGGAASASSPDRPPAFAHQDGPAFHGLFRAATRTGPISDTVAKLWRTNRSDAGAKTAALSFFPTSRGASAATAEEPAIVDAAPTAPTAPLAPMPQPPRRPESVASARAARPLDLSTFMKSPKA